MCFGKQGKWHLFQENREQRSNFEWNRIQRQYWVTWNIKNNFRFLGNRETSLFISGEQGNGYPPRRVS